MDKGPNDWSDGKHTVDEDFFAEWDEYIESSTFNYRDMVTSYGDLGTVCDSNETMYFETTFIPVLYTIALVIGLLGNGLLLWVLVQKRRDWNVTDTFILHLGVADTLLLVTLPFWAAQSAQEQGWSFGTPLCKIIGAIFTINFYCGIFLLTCISLDCYLSIVHAAQMFSRKKAWLVHSSCLSVWLLSLILSIPDWIFLQAVKDDRRGDKTECIRDYQLFSQSTTVWSRMLYHIVGFLLPSAVLIFCYASILLQLQRGSQGLQKQSAVRVILALVAVFFLCWTPYNITLMVDTLQSNMSLSSGNNLTCISRTSLEKAMTVTSTLGYIHCSLNPVLYVLMSVKFRRHPLSIFRAIGRLNDV